jgi:hypothetical protein
VCQLSRGDRVAHRTIKTGAPGFGLVMPCCLSDLVSSQQHGRLPTLVQVVTLFEGQGVLSGSETDCGARATLTLNVLRGTRARDSGGLDRAFESLRDPCS